MSLQLILGSSGSGKSQDLYNEIIDKSIKHKDVNYLVIVPEQFTLQTQKEIVEKHPNHGTMNIDILSFLRLSHRVFDEVGGNDRPVLEDTGKSMILRKVLTLKKEELLYFGREANKIGFVNELKSLISEMYQYNIRGEDLENINNKINNRPMLNNKLQDITVIYQAFKEYLEERYITQEEILDVLCDVIEDSNLIKNSVISFDGFTGFTPAQYKLLAKLMKMAKKVVISLTIDDRENLSLLGEEFELFHLSKKTIHYLYKIAGENNVEIEDPIYPPKVCNNKVHRFKDRPALASLEKNLFRYPYSTYEKDQDEIQIHVAEDSKQEVSFVVRETMRLVREENYRYQDLAVITGDIGQYASILEREFEKAKIPVFIDNKRELLNNPYVEMIRSILDVIKNNFDYESIFRYLRCGLIDYSDEDLDILENYIIAFGIRGKSTWNKEWEKTYKNQGEGQLKTINKIRQEIVDYFLPLSDVLLDREKTVKDYTVHLYNHILIHNVEDKLDKFREKFEDLGMLSVAKEYEQIYDIVIDLFEKLVELLGEEKVSIDEYLEILEAGFSEAKVGVIPPGLDQVLVGDIERTRLNNVKAVFFVGVNDGIIPKKLGDGGILSDIDREILAQEDIEMAPTKRQEAYMERFYLYLIMTKPKDRLYLSYSKLDQEGSIIRPSYLIGVIQKLFPNLQIIDEEKKVENAEYVIGSDKGIEYLINGLRIYPDSKKSNYWNELFSIYWDDEEGQNILNNLIKGNFYSNEETSLKKDIARDLYGSDLQGSVTRFEQFSSCPFAHYAKYGLNLQERVEYSLEALDIGNLFHDALEIFSKKVYDNGNDWENLSEDNQTTWVDESVTEASENPNNTIFSSSKRHEYIVSRAKRITNRTVWALKQQISQSDFIPSGFEVSFSPDDGLESLDIPLSDNSRIRLYGRIDRIDIYEENNKIMVRVIDYKSGSTSFDLLSIYHGLQLQLAIYLNAAIELVKDLNPGKDIIPAGILYYHIDDPIVEKTGDVKESILKELKMDGVVNEDDQVIIHLDKNFMEYYEGEEEDEEDDQSPSKDSIRLKAGVTSNLIPVKTNVNGSFSKTSKTLSTESLKELEEYVTLLVKDYGEDILSGLITVSPYQLKNYTACTYCPYDGICGFDPKIKGYDYRKLPQLKNEEILAEVHDVINKQDNKEEGGDE